MNFETTIKLLFAAYLEKTKQSIAKKDWKSLDRLPKTVKTLRSLANQLEDLDRRVQRARAAGDAQKKTP
jgi:hypothetical protein